MEGKGQQLLRRTHITWASSTPMSQGDLEKQRREFWETAAAFGGKEEAWEAIKGAMEVWDRDLDLARAILDCAGIMMPVGELSQAYDELGFRYAIPDYCFNAPSNLTATKDTAAIPISRRSSRASLSMKSQSFSEEACKGPMKRLTIRLNTGLDITVELKPSIKTIEDLSKAAIKNIGPDVMAEGKRLLFFYSGKGPLDGDMKLDDLERLDGKTPIQAWISS